MAWPAERDSLPQGPDNISGLIDAWAERHAIRLAYTQPGQLRQNTYVERFNRTVPIVVPALPA